MRDFNTNTTSSPNHKYYYYYIINRYNNKYSRKKNSLKFQNSNMLGNEEKLNNFFYKNDWYRLICIDYENHCYLPFYLKYWFIFKNCNITLRIVCKFVINLFTTYRMYQYKMINDVMLNMHTYKTSNGHFIQYNL